MENKDIQLQKVLEQNEALKKEYENTRKKTNPTNLKKGMKQKSIIGAILLLILMLTGTFAWQSYQQRAINPFYDPSGNHGVRFHDRLELEDPTLPYTDARFGYANMVDPDLTIFAENFGDMDVFVRIQLREFMALDNEPVGIGPASDGNDVNRNNPLTWPVFRTSDININTRRWSTPAYTMGHVHEDFQLNLGQDEGTAGQLAFMPTFNHAVLYANEISPALPYLPAETPFVHANAFRASEATGAAVDWFTTTYYDGTYTDGELLADPAPAVGQVGNLHIRDFITYGIPTGPGVATATGAPFTTVMRRAEDTGQRDNWDVGDTLVSHRIYTYGIAPNVELRLTDNAYTHTAQLNHYWYVEGWTTADILTTLNIDEFRGVMTIQQWNDLQNPTGNFWIHDSQDDDGWFYWMGFLYGESNYPTPQDQVSTATSLLVESLNLPDLPGEWEYALTMTGEAFTQQTIDAELIDISDAAMRIFNVVLYEEARPLGGTITVAADGTITISQGLLDANMQAFTAVPNSLGSRQSTLPAEVTNHDLINIEGPGITSGDFTVTITGNVVRITENILPAAAIGCPWDGTPANLFVDSTGTEWCHVAVQGQYSMLISRHTHQRPDSYGVSDVAGSGTRNHSVNEFVRWPAITNSTDRNEGPEIRGVVNTWWNNDANVSPLLRGAAVHANIPILRTETLQASPSLYDAMHDETTVSTPIPGSGTDANPGLPFFLNHADINARLTDRRGPTVTAGAAAWDPDQSVISRSPGNSLRAYWLREPGCQGPGPTTASCSGAVANANAHLWTVAYVSGTGNRGGANAANTNWSLGFRPAAWVRR